MKKNLNSRETVLLVIAALLVGLTAFFPIWRIEIWAPQYPEGLVMRINSSSITGHVDQINILNHYIGMQKIDSSSIPELRVLPWVLATLSLSGVLIALLKMRRMAQFWFAIKLIILILGFIDFAMWGYDYGHNLDPNAPIKVPGLNYQPPLIGGKTLLNIQSYSLPDIGAYMLAVSILLTILVIFFRGKLSWPRGDGGLFLPKKKANLIGSLALVLLVSACKTGPEAIVAGEDHCDSCRMKISDTRFAAEAISKKGRVLKFDSIGCLGRYLKTEHENVKEILVSDFFQPSRLIPVEHARFLVGGGIRGPMGAGPVASQDEEALNSLKGARTKEVGEVVNWQTVSSSFK